MPRRSVVPVALIVSGLSLAACGGSSTTGNSTTTTTSPTTTSGKPSTSTSPSAGHSSAPTTTAAGTPAASSAAIPPVSNPTNLSKEPLPAPDRATPPSTLLRKDLVVGKGAVATASSTVVVRYVGASYSTGKVFDGSTWQSGPATFALANLVPGFAQGVTGMKVGGRREIVIPPALGYGSQGGGPIAPNETLVFVVDLLGVK